MGLWSFRHFSLIFQMMMFLICDWYRYNYYCVTYPVENQISILSSQSPRLRIYGFENYSYVKKIISHQYYIVSIKYTIKNVIYIHICYIETNSYDGYDIVFWTSYLHFSAIIDLLVNINVINVYVLLVF